MSKPHSQLEEPSRTVAEQLPEETPHPIVAPELQVEEPSPTITFGPQEVKEPLTSNIATLVGTFLGGLIAGVIICITAAVIVCVLAEKECKTEGKDQTSDSDQY